MYLQVLSQAPTAREVEKWLETGLLELSDGTTARVDAYKAASSTSEPDWACRLPTLDPAFPFLLLQGQSKRVAPDERWALRDHVLALWITRCRDVHAAISPYVDLLDN